MAGSAASIGDSRREGEAGAERGGHGVRRGHRAACGEVGEAVGDHSCDAHTGSPRSNARNAPVSRVMLSTSSPLSSASVNICMISTGSPLSNADVNSVMVSNSRRQPGSHVVRDLPLGRILNCRRQPGSHQF